MATDAVFEPDVAYVFDTEEPEPDRPSVPLQL
jgi:hypothetical protein